MEKNEFAKAHELMSERIKSESCFSVINSLDLSYDENVIVISLEMNNNNDLIYRLQLAISEDIIFLADFQEDISINNLVDSYIYLGDFISGNMRDDGFGLSWGRLTWILENNDELKKRKMDMSVAFVENSSGIYDGSENYIQLSFDIETVFDLKKFIKDSYEIIAEKNGL